VEKTPVESYFRSSFELMLLPLDLKHSNRIKIKSLDFTRLLSIVILRKSILEEIFEVFLVVLNIIMILGIRIGGKDVLRIPRVNQHLVEQNIFVFLFRVVPVRRIVCWNLYLRGTRHSMIKLSLFYLPFSIAYFIISGKTVFEFIILKILFVFTFFYLDLDATYN
jgi:hypothetical protein